MFARADSTRLRGTAVLVTAIIGGLALASVAFAALPTHVILLHGKTSQKLAASFTYNFKKHTINGFSVSYTCHGKTPGNDSDVYTISDGGDDSVAVAKVKHGKVHFNVVGQVSRFSEDGPVARGSGRLVVTAKVTPDGTKRILKGTTHVKKTTCPSADLTFRSAGRTGQ